MLTSLILQLKSPTEANLPATLGRASQAVLLRLIQQRDAALARELHESDRPKPFTASNLVLGQRHARQARCIFRPGRRAGCASPG